MFGLKWFKQRMCDHDWRPALVPKRGRGELDGKVHPCRICFECERVEIMTEAAFYAFFGYRGYDRARAVRQRPPLSRDR